MFRIKTRKNCLRKYRFLPVLNKEKLFAIVQISSGIKQEKTVCVTGCVICDIFRGTVALLCVLYWSSLFEVKKVSRGNCLQVKVR
jgi:hypothetical protein